MAESGKSFPDIAETFNRESVSSPAGKQCSKTAVHKMVSNEAYYGHSRAGLDGEGRSTSVRMDDAFYAIVPKS